MCSVYVDTYAGLQTCRLSVMVRREQNFFGRSGLALKQWLRLENKRRKSDHIILKNTPYSKKYSLF